MSAWEVAALESGRFLCFWVYPLVHWTMQIRQFGNLKRNVEYWRPPIP